MLSKVCTEVKIHNSIFTRHIHITSTGIIAWAKTAARIISNEVNELYLIVVHFNLQRSKNKHRGTQLIRLILDRS